MCLLDISQTLGISNEGVIYPIKNSPINSFLINKIDKKDIEETQDVGLSHLPSVVPHLDPLMVFATSVISMVFQPFLSWPLMSHLKHDQC